MSYKHILVAVDLTQSSQHVIDKAISLAKDGNSKLSFAYIDVDKVVLEPKEEQGFQNALKALAEKSDYSIADTIVANGDLHMKLKGIVKESTVDLVVCGHHHKVASRLFSSVPKLANAIEADLLVVYLDE
jgi:universal stress protein A